MKIFITFIINQKIFSEYWSRPAMQNVSKRRSQHERMPCQGKKNFFSKIFKNFQVHPCCGMPLKNPELGYKTHAWDCPDYFRKKFLKIFIFFQNFQKTTNGRVVLFECIPRARLQLYHWPQHRPHQFPRRRRVNRRPKTRIRRPFK